MIVTIAPIIGGAYGILHDQLTYTISPEYYTKFKFYQFGLVDEGMEAIFPNPRIQVSAVGFLATWWMGSLIGLFLGLVGLVHRDSKQMFRATLKAIVLTVSVVFATGLVGLAIGKFYLAEKGMYGWLPGNILDTRNFIAVGSMHNFSYLGGLLGLMAGAIYSVRQKREFEHEIKNEQSASS